MWVCQIQSHAVSVTRARSSPSIVRQIDGEYLPDRISLAGKLFVHYFARIFSRRMNDFAEHCRHSYDMMSLSSSVSRCYFSMIS